MASSRKKQDEKNLKTLRELAALPQNKYCFDCNQRGPTYVNVTIGSFVCTKCSGILRGITPPHRVKSISMATFTTEEVDLLRSRGNDYCRHIWLGLYEGVPPTHSGEEQAVRDFMVEKYERRRYYLDPGLSKPEETITVNNVIRPITQLVTDPKPIRINGTAANSVNNIRNRPEVNKHHHTDFVVDFEKADIFSNTGNSNLGQTQKNGDSFANFENNPVFNNNSNTGNPTPLVVNNLNNWNQQLKNNNNSGTLKGPPAPPPEDKYAALKDLDNALKSQGTLDWSSTGSNGSLYSSPTPTGSVYSSPSPQNSVFGSPNQGNFVSAFSSQENGGNFSNPFNNGSNINWISNGNNNGSQKFANPFRDPVKTNGFSQSMHAPFPMDPLPVNGNSLNSWTPNPFKVGAATSSNSNNPFL